MVANGPPVAGIARYAGMSPSAVGTFTSAASSPLVSVVIVSAAIGPAASANPVPSEVTRKPRRDQFARGIPLWRSTAKSSISVVPSSLSAATISDRQGRKKPFYPGRMNPRPVGLPVEQPTHFNLVDYLKTANSERAAPATRPRRRGDRLSLLCCISARPELALSVQIMQCSNLLVIGDQ